MRNSFLKFLHPFRSWIIVLFGVGVVLGIIQKMPFSNSKSGVLDLSRCSQPLGRLLEGDKAQIFKLSYHSKAHSDLGSLLTGANLNKPNSPPAAVPMGMAHELDMQLSADWYMGVFSQSEGKYLLVNTLRNPKLNLVHNGIHTVSEEERILSQLAKNFYLEVNERGQVLSIHAAPSLKAMEKNILRWVIAHFQMVFPEKSLEKKPEKNYETLSVGEWITLEFDPNGKYEAHYKVIPEPKSSSPSSETLNILKQKTKYLELSAYQKRAKRHPQELKLPLQIETQAQTQGIYECEKKGFASLKGNEDFKTFVSKAPIAETRDQFEFSLVDEVPLTDMERGNLMAEYRSGQAKDSSFNLVASESASEMERLIQKTELGDLTESKLISMLAQAKKAGDSKAIEDLYLKFKALVYLHPESAAKIGKILSQEDPTSKAMMVLATALSAVGSPEAQEALIQALNARPDNVEAVQVLVPALGMTEFPTQASEEALKSLIQKSTSEDIVTTAGLSLGVMASHLGDAAPNRQKQIVESIQRDFQNAETAEQRRFLISVLGNAGASDSYALIHNEMNSPDPTIQVEATLAMRSIPGKNAEEALFKALTESPNENVRKSAATSLGYREPSPGLSERIRNQFQAQSSEWVRREIVKNLFEYRSVDPKIQDWLKWVKDNDPSKEVREIAQDYYRLGSGG